MRAISAMGRRVQKISRGLVPRIPRAGSGSTRILSAVTIMVDSASRTAAVTTQKTTVCIATLRTFSGF